MNQEIKKLWIKALRSGKYEQGRGKLKKRKLHKKTKHCCLGVLCEIALQRGDFLKRDVSRVVSSYRRKSVIAWTFKDNEYGLPHQLTQLYSIPIEEANGLAYLNDNGSSFSDIADLIEKNL